MRRALSLPLLACVLAACGGGASHPPLESKRWPSETSKAKDDGSDSGDAGDSKGGDAAPAEAPRRPDLTTPVTEEQLGREGARQVAATQGVVDDPVLTPYVQAIGRRLARNAPGFRYDYQFHIVDDWPPNAFAIPGGAIFISRGLLALSNSEEELANVMGHEVAHVAQRHGAAQQQVAGGGVNQFFQRFSLAAYSRDLENTADRVGQGIAAVSGYDPGAMRDLLLGLDRLDRVYTGASRLPGFLDSHPGSRGRANEMGQRAGTIHWERKPGLSKSADDHLRKLEGLMVGTDPRQGAFVGNRFLHPDMAFTLRFPDEWLTQNSPQAVGALAPDRRSMIVLEFAGPGDDPVAAANLWLDHKEGQLGVQSAGDVKVAGRDAYRIRGRAGVGQFTTTFIPWRGVVFAITCVGTSDALDPICMSVTRSLRPMTRELLAQVREQRLHIAEARTGETLATLSKRTGNEWTIAETAAWNAMQANVRFQGGELVKIVKSQPYVPQGVKAGGDR